MFILLAYEAYCKELKIQLEELKVENEDLKRRPGSADADALELLSTMTSLDVHCSGPQRYSCKVSEGILEGKFMLSWLTCHKLHLQCLGHTFILTLDKHSREYTYNPEGSSVQNLKQIAADFSIVIFFPEHMLSRFLINLLHVNYVSHDCA